MYKITIRGQEPVFVEDKQGKLLWECWTEVDGAPKLSTKVVVGNVAFYASDIRSINKVVKSEAELAPNRNNVADAEYLEFRQKMLALTVEQRANIMRIPNMIWKSCTKAEMPEHVKTEIKARQLAYLKENPKCMYANPKVYRELIENPHFRRNIENMSPIQNIIPSAFMRLIENLIQTDLQYSIR